LPVVVEMDFIERGRDCHPIGVERRAAGLEQRVSAILCREEP
jgi:hypothetical protein